VGVGVEREVLFTTFDRMAKDTSKYLTLLYGGYHSVATTLSQSNIAHCLSDKRRVGLGVLGALTSMMIINNMNPDPISPVLLQYFIHDCNIHSIHPDFLKEWHPDLFQLLQTWRDIGPTGDLSMFQTHFSIYHDIQVS
jgi:hypothetical protein